MVCHQERVVFQIQVPEVEQVIDLMRPYRQFVMPREVQGLKMGQVVKPSRQFVQVACVAARFDHQSDEVRHLGDLVRKSVKVNHIKHPKFFNGR